MSNVPGIQKPSTHSNRDHLLGRKLRDGEYLMQRVLGHGGMGKVYLAMHTSLEMPFALKQARADQPLPESVIAELDLVLQGGEHVPRTGGTPAQEPDFPATGGVHTDRFLREALLLTRLQHSAIPTLYDYFFEDGFWYLVMDYIPGSTFSHYLHTNAPLPPLEALNYAIQICDVLDYLHRQSPSIVFRDLKPSNLILTPDGALMLVDFGIARYFKTGQVNDTMDLGSPGYASPEQYQGEGQTDGRSDLFSLGIILREMLTGKRPSSVSNGTSDERPISPAMAGLITLATRPEPDQRFQSAHTFYLALERIYAIEEQLAYQRHIDAAATGNALNNEASHAQSLTDQQRDESEALPAPDDAELVEVIPAQPANNTTMIRLTLPIMPVLSFNLEQRQQTRDALQQARRERLKQESLEIQMASVDESLKRRSLVLLSQTSHAQAIKKPDPSPAELPQAPQTRHTLPGMLKICFLFTLILCLLLASLFSYMRITHSTIPVITRGQPQAPSPTNTPMLAASWQLLPSPPSTEADNTAIYVQTGGRFYIYMSGGYRGTASPQYDRNLYRYDIQAAQWEQLSLKNFPGMLNNSVAEDERGQLFFTTGYSTDTYKVTPLLTLYQPATGQMRKITPPTSITFGFATAMLTDQQGHLYLTEGYQKAGDPAVEAGTGWYRYDIASDTWQTLAPLPVSLGYATLVYDANGNILLLGGATDAGQTHQSERIYRYDITHNQWLQQPFTLPHPLSGSASCALDSNHILIVGGYDANRKQGVQETWLFNVRTQHWTQLDPFPKGGSVLGAIACDGHDHAYLIRGASDPRHPTADFWLLTLHEG
jgi:serine/threonine protein kinase